MTSTLYDLIIIGAGPAGLSSSIFASRYKIKHLILTKSLGGTIVWASEVANYPGFVSVTGAELAQKFLEQAQKLGSKIENKEVAGIKKDSQDNFTVITVSGSSYKAKSLIIATGTKRRQLGVAGEKEFLGRGVSYCCVCDGPFFKDKNVAVIGGANAACSGAVYLSRFAKKVFLIYRKSKLRAEGSWLKDVTDKKNIEILYETNIVKIEGKDRVEKIVIDKSYQGLKELAVTGVFIEVGGIPISDLLKGIGGDIDESGYAITDCDMATNVKGVFCVGDVNAASRNFQQVIIACAQGAIAANSVYSYLKNL